MINDLWGCLVVFLSSQQAQEWQRHWERAADVSREDVTMSQVGPLVGTWDRRSLQNSPWQLGVLSVLLEATLQRCAIQHLQKHLFSDPATAQRHKQWLSWEADVPEGCHPQSCASPVPHRKRHRESTKGSKAVDSTYSRPWEGCWSGVSFLGISCSSACWPWTQMWGAPVALWCCFPKSRSSISLVEALPWVQGLHPRRGRVTNSLNMVPGPSMSYTQWQIPSEHPLDPYQATTGLALRPTKHPLSFLRCIFTEIPVLL